MKILRSCQRCNTGFMVPSIDGSQCVVCGFIEYDDDEVVIHRQDANFYGDRFVLPYIGAFAEMKGRTVTATLVKNTESLTPAYSGIRVQPIRVSCAFCGNTMQQVNVGGYNFARWPHYRYRCQYDHRISIPTGMEGWK